MRAKKLLYSYNIRLYVEGFVPVKCILKPQSGLCAIGSKEAILLLLLHCVLCSRCVLGFGVGACFVIQYFMFS